MAAQQNPFSKEIEIMAQIFENILRRAETCWNKRIDLDGDKLDPKTRENYDGLVNWLRPEKWENLKSKLTDACSKKAALPSSNLGRFYLPPVSGDDGEFVPVFTLEADFSQGNPEVNIRVALLSYDNDTGKLHIFGCRFETPEIGSNHDFCHAQFTRDPLGFGAGQYGTCEMISEWAPQSVPCLLAPARGPASLLVWLMVGIYGRRAFPLFGTMKFDSCYKEPLQYLENQ